LDSQERIYSGDTDRTEPADERHCGRTVKLWQVPTERDGHRL